MSRWTVLLGMTDVSYSKLHTNYKIYVFFILQQLTSVPFYILYNFKKFLELVSYDYNCVGKLLFHKLAVLMVLSECFCSFCMETNLSPLPQCYSHLAHLLHHTQRQMLTWGLDQHALPLSASRLRVSVTNVTVK